MNRGALSWIMGGAGFLLAALLFALLALSSGRGGNAPSPAHPAPVASHAPASEKNPWAGRLPIPEELGIVLPADPEQAEPVHPIAPAQQEQPAPAEKSGQEDSIRDLERQGILAY